VTVKRAPYQSLHQKADTVFYYFGRKGRLAPKYPAPQHDLVIEPFAGSGAYSLYWKPEDALLIDIDPHVVDLWHQIIDLGPEGIEAYPPPEVGSRTSESWHLAAMASKSGSPGGGSMKVSKFALQNFETSRRMALRSHAVGSRFSYTQGTYRDAPSVEATWFIDPPYQAVKTGYRSGSSTVDFWDLGEWVMERKGLVIVCEGPGASWLPFRPFLNLRALNGFDSKGSLKTEMWWCNQPDIFDQYSLD